MALSEVRENRTIRAVQQSFAEMLGHGEEIIWDLLSEQQSEILKNKINELIRDPVGDVRNPTAQQIRQRNAVNRMRDTLFNSVWEQRKFTNKNSLTSIIYVLVATDETDWNRAVQSRKWSCHPVFRTRRCISKDSGRDSNSSDCCMIFVDENGRVYHNWRSFIDENELPAGILVAPARGTYTLRNGEVQLDRYFTPAGTPKRKLLGILDTSSAIAGFAAACAPVAALLTIPVAAPVMAVAAGVGLASASYATARSGTLLYDRSQHEQSINVKDRAARGHWLGFLGGAVGLGAAGATGKMAAATIAGKEVGVLTQLTVNGFNISSILLSGTGVANGAIDLLLKFQDGDDVTAIDLLQLSASLVLFTHSVSNFRLASTIISDTQNSTIASYRETLSNKQRRAFDKISKETIRVRGSTKGKVDIIRHVNEVPSKQQFNDLFKINKNMNKEGVRAAFAPDGSGGIVLNEQVTVTNTQDLRANVQQNAAGPNILGQVTQPIPEAAATGSSSSASSRNAPVRLLGPNTLTSPETPEPSNFAIGVREIQLSSIFVKGVLIKLADFGPSIYEHIVNAESFENLIHSMANHFQPEIFNFTLNLTETFMKTIMDELHTVLKFFISTESVLYRILKHLLDHYRNNLNIAYIAERTWEILRAVRDYFMSLDPNNFGDLLKKCDQCPGYFHIFKL